MKFNELTIAAAQSMMEAGELTSLDLTKACLNAIKHKNKDLNICLLVDEIGALKAAKEADERRRNGDRGELLGIPFLVKDNIMTKNLKTTAASMMLKDYIAPYDATVVARLKKAGAILLGKTNLDEFAHGASTEYSAFGVTKNPWDKKKVAGGSSGGSAAAVASDFCLFALGTDTGGSVRHPASFCGVVGLKPSYGACSRFGLISMTSSTDVPGCLTKNSEDAYLVLKHILGYDPKDSTSLNNKKQLSSKLAKQSLKNLKIGIPKEISGLSKKVDSSFKKFKEDLKKAGAKIVLLDMPSVDYALAAYYIITPCEISSNLARFDGLRFGSSVKASKLSGSYEATREANFGPEVKRRIILGTYCLSAGYYEAYYLRAQKLRTKVINDFKKSFDKCDFIITPTTPTEAFEIAKKKDPLKMYLEDIFLVPASLAGLPALSIPVSKKPLPIGLQIIGNFLDEQRLLSVASAFEELAVDRSAQPNL